MKTFVLHCNDGYAQWLSAVFFNLKIVRILKKGTNGTRLIRKKTLLSELANFSASDRLGGNFPTVQNGLK